MNSLQFGTDGVRGRALEVSQDVPDLIRAAGIELMQEGDTMLLGWDTRESSQHIALQVAAGLTAIGRNVELGGVMPTPALAYSVRDGDLLAAGAMITASHNTYQDNGIKIFGPKGNKLTDREQAAIEAGRGKPVHSGGFGHFFTAEDYQSYYKDFLELSTDIDLRGVTLAIDTAHGAASGMAEEVFSNLGAKVIALHDEPNGRNINVRSGATDTAVLQSVSKEKGIIGIALDGDADRLILVDERGRLYDGDRTMYMGAISVRADGSRHEGLVATIMTNLAVERELNSRGIALHRTNVGDRYVLEGLAETGYKLGGEQSGHIIHTDKLATGDGMLAALQALWVQRASGRSLAEWHDSLAMVPQKLINIEVVRTIVDDPGVQDMLEREQKLLGDSGRIVTRASGTENKVRVMVESPNAEADAERVAQQIIEFAQAA